MLRISIFGAHTSLASSLIGQLSVGRNWLNTPDSRFVIPTHTSGATSKKIYTGEPRTRRQHQSLRYLRCYIIAAEYDFDRSGALRICFRASVVLGCSGNGVMR